MARISKTGLIINYMTKSGNPPDGSLKSEKLNGIFFTDLEHIFKKLDGVDCRRASTWEIKILFEKFIL